MTWFDWVLVGWWAVGALLVTATVGQPRKPTSPGLAVFVLILNVTFTVGLLWTRGVLG